MSDTQTIQPPDDMRTFSLIWISQVISTLGSSLTGFAAGFWLLEQTGSITSYALINVFFLLPTAIVSLFAGAIVDRASRKRVMMLADTAQAIGSLAGAVLFFSGLLRPWHLYPIVFVISVSSAFQRPAWSASVPLIVPKQQLGRASGMSRLGQAIARLISPALAGVLILTIGLGGIILIDVATYAIAVTALLLVAIPDPPRTEDDLRESRLKRLPQDIRVGVRYLTSRKGLFTLVILTSLLNLFVNFAGTLRVPMMLTLANEPQVGGLYTIMASGMLVGSLIMTAWGGPQNRRIPLIMGFIILQGLGFALTGMRPSLALITVGGFITLLCFAFISSNYGPVLQIKVDLEVQGRVFATTGFLAMILEPLGQLVVGPLTDNVFEPLMQPGAPLARVFAPVVGGVGEGRGMALLFVMMGLLIAGLGAFGMAHPRVRRLEMELPDVVPDAEKIEDVEEQSAEGERAAVPAQ